MKRHAVKINALNALTIMIIIIIMTIIIVSMISTLLIICTDGNSNNINNNNDSGNLLSSLASDAAVGILTELGANHMGIYSKPTETETKIEHNFLTHNCNKFCANPNGGSRSRSSKTSSDNNNYSNIEKTINRTPVAQINKIIKNVQTRGCCCFCCLASKSLTPHLDQHEGTSWPRATHNHCFGKNCCSCTNVTSVKVRKIQKRCRFADLKAAFSAPEMRPHYPRYRAKRFLIFDDSAVVKFVAGTAFPVILTDKLKQVSVTNNFQAQYVPLPSPIYWWSFVNTTTFAARQARALPLPKDTSRAFIYSAMEHLLESKGLPGTVCLLKAICFVSQQPFDGSNIFHALLNAILTPSAENIDAQYLDARRAGRYGVDCEQTFKECPKYTKWLQGVKLFL